MIVWEFRARKGAVKRFQKVYGPAGDWAKFFAQGKGFVRTELVRDRKQAGRFLTLDFWTSEDAYVRFRKKHAAEYEALDKICEKLTEYEAKVGGFERC